MVRVLLCFLFFFGSAVSAEPPTKKAYVSDRVEVALRGGKGPKAKTIRMVLPGTPLTVIEQDAATGMTLVVLGSGERGWIPTRYVAAEPAARAQLDELRAENERLRRELAAFKVGLDGTDAAAQRLQAENERLNSELVAIRQASLNILQIEADRNRLAKEVATLRADLEVTRRENQGLKDSSREQWFLRGAGVLFAGVLLGVLLPRLNLRRRNSWDSL